MSSEKESKRKERVRNFMKENLKTIITSLFVLQLANFLSTYFFKKGFFILTILLMVFTLIAFFIGKDFAEEKTKKYAFKITQIAVLIFIFSIVNDLFLMLGEGLREESEAKANALFKLGNFINMAIGIASFALFRKPEVQETLQNVYENSLLEKLGVKSETAGKKPGDVQVAINKETGKPDILPYKDRFLHMLILGPTGSGKTSQSILPMINQDMQYQECGITVIEPKSDLAEKVFAMAKYYNRPVIYFNPVLPNCPYFNPLHGKEEDVIENIVTTFNMLNGNDSSQFFKDQNEILLRNALKVLKRTMGNDCTFIDLYTLIANPGGAGRKQVMAFSRMNVESAEMAKENSDISAYFLNDYFNEKSKTYEYTSGIRTAVAKIVSNKYLRKVLNPPPGKNDIDFDKHLEEGGVIAVATAQGALRDLGRYLGYFIILQFQASVFRRPGNENTRRPHFLYIDEFQVYSNPGFADMLTQGRSYRVASILATQNRALIGMGSGQEGKDFVELVSTNARNVIIYPGGNASDAKYYSEQFGEIYRKKESRSISKQKFNPLLGFRKMNYANESVSISEQKEALFSPTDIMYRPFGEITYLLIKNNSIQKPAVGQIQYIPKNLNDTLDKMIEEYNQTIFQKANVDLTKEEMPVLTKEVVIEEPVMAKNPIVTPPKEIPVVTKEVPVEDDLGEEDDFLIEEEQKKSKSKERQYISPDEEFTDDIVLEADDKPYLINEPSKDFDFMNDEEDDLI